MFIRRRRTLEHEKRESAAIYHCERSEAISLSDRECFVAEFTLSIVEGPLAMTFSDLLSLFQENNVVPITPTQTSIQEIRLRNLLLMVLQTLHILRTNPVGSARQLLVFMAGLFSFSLLLPFLFFFTLVPAFAGAATVAAVLDGDTIKLTDGTMVRYLAVNAPERGQPFYEEAKRYNERLVLGKTVRLETTRQQRDTYRRTLAYVYVGNTLVNAQLIAEGWGHLFVIDSFDRYHDWLQLQKHAQAQRKGMWRAGGVPGPLKITTVRADAEGDDRRNLNGEYVRICNVSDHLVELQGFSVQDASGQRYVFPEGQLDPGYTALLLSGKGRDTTRRGQGVFHWGSARPIWNNDGDTAALFDPDGKLIDVFQVQGKGNRE